MDLVEEDIALARGSAGLGFNIKGGIDIPHVPGEFGIFVTKIREDGAAFSDGRLKEGDKILSINERSLVQVTHQEAVACFMNAGETVRLRVQHDAEEQIKLKLSEEEKKNSFNNSIFKRNDDDENDEHSNTTFLFTALGILTTIAGLAAVGFIYYKKFKS